MIKRYVIQKFIWADSLKNALRDERLGEIISVQFDQAIEDMNKAVGFVNKENKENKEKKK